MEAIISPAKLRRVMSRDARELIESLVVASYHWYVGTRPTDPQAGKYFNREVDERFDPIYYEIAVLYASPKSIMTAITNRTAKAYDKNAPLRDIKAGTLRNPSVDYIQVALAAPEFWYKLIKIPRTDPLQPDRVKNNFTFHRLYNDVTSWLAADCTYSDLYFLWNVSNDQVGVQVIQQILSKATDAQYANCGILKHKYKEQYQIEQMQHQADVDGLKKTQKLYEEVNNRLNERPISKAELEERVRQFREDLNYIRDFASIPATTVAEDGTILMAKSTMPEIEPTWKFGSNNMSERKMRELMKSKGDKK